MAEKTIGMRDLNDRLQTAGLDDHDMVLEAIEALKRWIYGDVYQGPVKEPVPATENEFSLLMNGLRRWATLHATSIDTGRIQDYRRAELGLPGAFGPTRHISDQFAKREWCQAAARADDALNELRILLRDRLEQKTVQPKGRPGRKGYPLEALEKAHEIRRKHPHWKAVQIRRECLNHFSEEDLPPDGDSFRRWMNRSRKRANRAN